MQACEKEPNERFGLNKTRNLSDLSSYISRLGDAVQTRLLNLRQMNKCMLRGGIL